MFQYKNRANQTLQIYKQNDRNAYICKMHVFLGPRWAWCSLWEDAHRIIGFRRCPTQRPCAECKYGKLCPKKAPDIQKEEEVVEENDERNIDSAFPSLVNQWSRRNAGSTSQIFRQPMKIEWIHSPVRACQGCFLRKSICALFPGPFGPFQTVRFLSS